MKKLLLLAIAIQAAMITSGQSIGPSTLNATGGSNSIAGNTYEWSVGEMALVNTFSAAGFAVTQGVLQPVDGPLNVATSNTTTSNVVLFPNPANDVLYLQPQFKTDGLLKLNICDMAGRKVLEAETQLARGDELQMLDVNMLPAANYLLHLTYICKGTEIHNTYKITKAL